MGGKNIRGMIKGMTKFPTNLLFHANHLPRIGIINRIESSVEMRLPGDLSKTSDNDDRTSRSVGREHVCAASGRRHDDNGACMAFDRGGDSGNRYRHRRIRGGRRIL